MSLRSVLLLGLLAIALAGVGLYAGLTRSGGVGLPGGKIAIEQSLAPYVKAGSVAVSQPRAAYMDDGEGVILTLRSARFELASAPIQVELQRIRARIDAQRLSVGAIRIHDVTIGKAAITHSLAESAAPQDPINPQSVFADIASGYDMAFSDIHLERLAALDVKQLIVQIVDEKQPVAQGQGKLILRPAGEAVQLNADLEWSIEHYVSGMVASKFFAVAGPQRPLDLVVSASSEALARQSETNGADAESVALKAELVAGQDSAARLRLDVNAGAATLLPGSLYKDGATFGAAAVSAVYDVPSDQLTVKVKQLELDDTTFTAQAALTNLSSPDIALTADGQFSDMRVATLKAFWPRGLGEGGRKWVTENIDEGLLLAPTLRAKAPLSDLIDDSAPADALEIRFDLKDALAHYRRPMPPLIGGAASAVMTLDNMRFDIASGTVGDVDVAGSTVFLTSFRNSPQRAEINLRVDGDAGKLATVLDSEPLEYFTTYGLAPTALAGPITGRSLLSLPLLRDLPIDDVRISARLDANQLQFRDVLEGVDAALKRIVLELTQDGMKLRGDYALDGLDGAIRWEEDFRGVVSAPTQVQLSGKIAPEGLPRWLPGAADVLFGTVFYDAQIGGRGSAIASAEVTADLTAAVINIPELGYDKPTGVAAELYAAMKSEGDAIAFDALTLNGPDMLVIADGRYNDTARRASIVAQTVEIGETKGSLSLSGQGGAWLLAGLLDTLDVRPILDLFWSGGLAPPAGEAADASSDTILSVSIDAKTILLDNDQVAGQTRFLGSIQGDHIRQLNVFGQGPEDAPFTLTIEPIELGRRLVLAAQEAGPLASGLGMLKTAEGGQLTVQATSFERGEEFGLAGILEMTDIRLTEAPVLAKLLGLGSLSGVADLARDRGINFTDVEVPFELKNGIVRVTNASAYGPAMGLTADGEFLDSLEKADIRGVIVPSYTINSALGKVPLLGNLIIGGENTGLFGINYKITGALDDPELDVNPASVLTPGFLRGIFGRQRGRLGEVQTEPLSPTAEAGGL
ncbi:MAG: AsmA-like C-terminal region-containing protein [Pseudomonadota bacterium]